MWRSRKHHNLRPQFPLAAPAVGTLVTSLRCAAALAQRSATPPAYYISAFGWFGFLLTALLFVVVVVAAIAATSEIGRPRRA